MSTNPRITQQAPQDVITPATVITQDMQREAIELDAAGNVTETTCPPRTPEIKRSQDKLILKLRAFWRQQVSVVVAHDDCRDHLGESDKYS